VHVDRHVHVDGHVGSQVQFTKQCPYGGAPTLAITVHSATFLKDVEAFGKQDPYLRLSLDLDNAKSFQKTFVHKNAGKNPVWNQSFTLPLNGESELYIEIMDEETTADAVIAYAAIPINQVIHAAGGSFNGTFEVYTAGGKPNGTVDLTLTAYNVPGLQTTSVKNHNTSSATTSFVRGQSHINEIHQKRIRSIKNKEAMADAGMAVAGGLLAVAGGLLANKVSNDQRRQEQERKEAEYQKQVEREKFESERKRFEEERASFERAQVEEQTRLEREQIKISSSSSSSLERREEHYNSNHQDRSRCEHNSGNHCHDRHSCSCSCSHCHGSCDGGHSKKHGTRDWDPVGTYAAGDKVKYHGRDYICLQGHTSNPTWEPTQAHSLWRAD
ncbi:hypothetical protein BX616_010044, partial [Lobosporangium transversale]